MTFNPESYDRLHALWKKFDRFPEAGRSGHDFIIKREAFLAFLDIRPLILEALNAIHVELRGWQPLDRYFEAEPETPVVLLWALHPVSGEMAVQLGYWDQDEACWYREGAGPDLGSVPIEPIKWMGVSELMRQSEYVVVERME